MYDEATKLLESDMGKAICRTSLVCDELRRAIWTLKGAAKDESQLAQDKILKQGCARLCVETWPPELTSFPSDRNWLEFLSILDATFSDVTSPKEVDDAVKAACREQINKTQEFLAQVADRDGVRDRSGPLALLELELRSRKNDLSTGMSRQYSSYL